MTRHGTAKGRFAHAIRDRYLIRAVMACYELEHVTLENALELPILAAEQGDKRWPTFAAALARAFRQRDAGNWFG
jgi:hypothetical protein